MENLENGSVVESITAEITGRRFTTVITCFKNEDKSI